MRVKFNYEEFVKKVKPLFELTGDVPIRFKKNNANITFMDPANVAMVSTDIECEGKTKDFILSAYIMKGISKAKVFKPESIEFEVTTLERDKLVVAVYLDSFSRLDFFCYKPEKPITNPELEYDMHIITPKKALKDSINWFKHYSERITLRVEKVNFWFDTVSDYNDSSVNLNFGSKYDISVGEYEAKASYSLEYLEKAIKIMNNDVSVQFKTDYPIRLSDNETMFILAPRFEDE